MGVGGITRGKPKKKIQEFSKQVEFEKKARKREKAAEPEKRKLRAKKQFPKGQRPIESAAVLMVNRTTKIVKGISKVVRKKRRSR